MKQIIIFSIAFLPLFSIAQNVGIGTASPTQKLDVNGNMNVSGNLRVNGVAGQAGQVLVTNSSGATGWGSVDAAEKKNFAGFSGSQSWTVPAGVKKILIEAWGAGGGGNFFGGGAGGGYATAHFGVTPGGVVTIDVGIGGVKAGNANAGAGATTSVAVPDSFATTYTVYAFGGQGANFTGNLIFTPGGGTFSVNPGYYNMRGEVGRSGEPNDYSYTERTAGVFIEIVKGGKGGDAANTINTGGVGCIYIPSGKTGQPSYGLRPGGGGGGGSTAAFTDGGYGGGGYVVIRY
jgi:hypothetical protein